MSEQTDKVPITVVTGFLGAGKTTLVNHILKGSHGKRIAIVENEFGEVGIDDALVMETKEEVFEMNNGCVCCTVRGDLIRILTKLLRRKSRFDAILIETTGLANPAPVIQTFFVDDAIKDGCVLDAVLGVADARHLGQHLAEVKPDGVVNEAVQQIAFADKILLNKIDLVTPEEKAGLISTIRSINRSAPILECSYSSVDLDQVLGVRCFSLDKLLERDPEFLDDGAADAHHHDDHHHDGDHHEHHDHDRHEEHAAASGGGAKAGHHDHVHDSRVGSVGIVSGGACDMRKLNAWLGALLQEKGGDIYRSKGILAMANDDAKYVFQGVHMLLQFSSSKEGIGRPWREGEERVNKVVFIGKDLNRQELEEGFKACLVDA